MKPTPSHGDEFSKVKQSNQSSALGGICKFHSIQVLAAGGSLRLAAANRASLLSEEHNAKLKQVLKRLPRLSCQKTRLYNLLNFSMNHERLPASQRKLSSYILNK